VATMTPCPFCFNGIDSSNLGYLCANQGNVKCPKEVDPERQKITGSGAALGRYIEPSEGRKGIATCSQCQGETRRRACPVCHTPLSIDFAGTRSPMLGMVGSKGSGKTVLMTVMIQQLRKVIALRFNADISIATDNPDGMQSISEYMKGREANLYKGGLLPEGTPTYEAGRRVPIVLRWRADRKSTLVAFLDSAGEDFNTQESTSGLKYLCACDYLIVALDPFSLPGARDQINLPKEAVQNADNVAIYALHQITEQLRTHYKLKATKKIAVPVAIVFTKIDAFFPVLEEGNPILASAPAGASYDETDGLAVHERMKALLREWDAWEIESHMSKDYETYRYFGVSALGEQPDYANSHVAAGGVRPHRVADPILWLMSKARMVKAVKSG
jgi:Double-GTPase 2